MIDLNHSRNLAPRPRAGCLLALTEPLPGRKAVLALLMRLLWATALVLPAFGASGGVVFTSLHSFQVLTNGAYPNGLVQGRNGNFYDTTYADGQGGAGTVFRLTILPPQLTITPSGANVVLTWPADATGFTLVFATNLVSPTVWQTNATVPVVISGQNIVTNPVSGPQQSYRLSQ
jgi:hypothetical protein